jgi:hypothetical protein
LAVNDRATFLVVRQRLANDEGMTKSEARKEVRVRPLVI